MFEVVSGAVKSGKSAYIVNEIRKLKKQHPESIVVSNIPGHESDFNFYDYPPSRVIYEFSRDQTEIETLGLPICRTIPNPEQPVIYAIDECRRFFSRTFVNRLPSQVINQIAEYAKEDNINLSRFQKGLPDSTYFFFDYHAHWSVTAFLGVHKAKSLSDLIIAGSEHVIQVQRASKRIGKRIYYFQTEDGWVTKDDPKLSFPISDVQGQYISSETGETVKPRNSMLIRYKQVLSALTVLLLISLAIKFYVLPRYKSDQGDDTITQITKTAVNSVISDAVTPSRAPVSVPLTEEAKLRTLRLRLELERERDRVTLDKRLQTCKRIHDDFFCISNNFNAEGIGFQGEYYERIKRPRSEARGARLGER